MLDAQTGGLVTGAALVPGGMLLAERAGPGVAGPDGAIIPGVQWLCHGLPHLALTRSSLAVSAA